MMVLNCVLPEAATATGRRQLQQGHSKSLLKLQTGYQNTSNVESR